MIIKLIAENQAEVDRLNGNDETTYSGVEDYFFFGKNESKEFHEWHGGYKFLIGNLAYYTQIVQDERTGKNSGNRLLTTLLNKSKTDENKFIKHAHVENANITILNPEDIPPPPPGFETQGD
jgi:hypothetical protein